MNESRLPLDKIVEGDPVEVLPSEPLAGSQAGLNGPSGSPTSPSTPAYPTDVVACPRCDGIGEVEDDLWVWTRCYSCWGRGEIEVCAFCLDSGEECDVCGC